MNKILKQIPSRAKSLLLSLPVMMTAGFIVSYLLLGYFAVNPIAQRVLPWVGENKLASKLSASRVSFDPLRLALTVEQLNLSTPEGSSLAGLERFHADLEVSGIMRWSWRLKDVQLSKPHLTFESRKGGGSNWSALIAKLNETPDDEPQKGMARLLIDHLLIAQGDIEYIDNNRAETFRAVLEPLDLELDGFSTLPEDLGDYAILAKLPEQGGTLKWKGELGLNPLFSNGKVELEGLRLAKLLKVLPPGTLPIRLNEGNLKTSLDYEFALKDDQAHVKVSKLSMLLEGLTATLLQSRDQSGALRLQQAQLNLPSLEYLGTPQPQLHLQDLTLELHELGLSQSGVALLELPSVQLDGLGFDLQARQLDIASVKLASGNLHAVRDANGEINWQWLQQAVQQPEKVQATKSDTQPEQNQTAAANQAGFNVVLHELALQEFALDFEDKSFKQPLKLAAQDFQLNLQLAAQNGNVEISELNSAIGPLQVRSGQEKKPVATLSKIDLSGGKLDLSERKLDIAAITLQGLQSDIIKSANGINWQNLLQTANATSQSAEPKSSNTADPAAPAWNVELARLALQNAALHIEDQTPQQAVKLDLDNLGLELSKLSLDTKRALPVKLGFKVKQGGSFNLDGKLTPATLNADFNLKLSELSLLPFAPYVNQAALLKLNAGQFNSAGQLSLKQAKNMEYKGGFSVDKLDITEEEGGQPFLAWHSLLSNSLTLSNHSLHMAELQIHQPKGKFIIYEDRSLNIKRIMRDQGQSAGQAPLAQAAAPSTAQPQTEKPLAKKAQSRTGKTAKSKPAQAESKPVAPVEPAAAKPDFAIAIERIRIDQAQLEFADLSLRPQFGTYINSLSGVINGLSSEPRATAQVELDGKVDEFGSARIRGAVQPFQATEFTDLKLVFRNLEMNRLTPYSGKFAGRRIDAGKLSVDLEYKIKQRKLAGENKFVINKLKLGDKVESEDAVNLPLDLAIALLEDSNGIIDLDLPVSGSLDDPEFSYGKVVWKALVNVLGKIVTSPFRALGNLLGLGSDKLEALVFDTGSAKLAPPEQEKLKALSTALAKRPNLLLSIAPVIDEKRDARALQEQSVRNQVIAKTGVKLAPGEQAGPVDLGNSRIRLALSKLVREQLSHEKVAALRKQAKDYAKDKDEQEAQQYEYAQMLEALVSNTKVEAAWLPTLSQARAQAVQQYLQVEQGLPAERLKLLEPKQVSASGTEVSMPLELGVAKH